MFITYPEPREIVAKIADDGNNSFEKSAKFTNQKAHERDTKMH